MKFEGTYTAVVTPFTSDGSKIDFKSFGNLIEFQIEAGVQGIVVCGSTGEAQTLGDSEYKDVVLFAKEAIKKRVPLISGIGASATEKAVGIASFLKESSVDGVLVVAPPYNKPPQRGIEAHFRAVHDAAKLPLIAYNIPGRASVNILPETLRKLADSGTIVSVKESSGSMDQVVDLLSMVRDRVSVLSGEDSLVLPMMVCGGRGVISAVANVIPKSFVKITSSALKGDWEMAKDAQFEALPWIRAMFAETNPIPVKTALAKMKVIDYPTLRLPLVAAASETSARIDSLLKGDAR